MAENQLECCPYCSSNTGYYVRTQIRGTCESKYTFDGKWSDEDNADMHDRVNYKFGKWAYCRDCNKKLFEVNS